MGDVATIDRAGRATTDAPLDERIVEAMLDCIARHGVARTTADDIARAAGVSRATLYRAFPGGKEVVFEALVRHEARRFFHAVTERLDAAEDLEDLLVVGIVEAARFLAGHEPLSYLLAHEPERVLPEVAFHRLDRALAVAVGFTEPHLRRFIPDPEAAEIGAEWLVRILVSYAINPAPSLDLTDEASVRRFAVLYLLPALVASSEPIPASNVSKES